MLSLVTKTTGCIALALAFASPVRAQCAQELLFFVSGGTPTDGDEAGAALAADAEYAVLGAPGFFSGLGAIEIRLRFANMSWGANAWFIDPTGETNTGFGRSVAIGGDFAAAGIPQPTLTTPRVATYRRNGPTWEAYADAQAPSPQAGSEFGFAVELDGDRLFVGAPSFQGGSGTFGAVFVFDRKENGTPSNPADDFWLFYDRIDPLIGVAGMRFGHALDVEGGALVIGAPRDQVTGPGSLVAGSASFYVDFPGTGYVLDDKVFGEDSLGDFGSAVSISGDRVIVGAPQATAGLVGLNPGAAYTYDFNGSAWILNERLSPAGAPDGHRFGEDVDLVGDSAVVGGPHSLGAPSLQPGMFYGYVNNGGAWDEVRASQSEFATNGDLFGAAVALTGGDVTGDLALVGAPRWYYPCTSERVGAVEYRGTTLEGCPPVLFADDGGTYTLSVSAGESNAGKQYAVFGSVTGTSPGLDLDGNNLPLVTDAYFTLTGNQYFTPGCGGAFCGFVGILDAQGRGTATMTFNPDPGLAGLPLYHAFAVTDTLYVTPWEFTSHAVDAAIVAGSAPSISCP